MRNVLSLIFMLFLCTVVAADSPSNREVSSRRPLADFSKRADIQTIRGDEGVRVDFRSGTVEMPARQAATVTLFSSDAANFSGYDELRLSLECIKEGLTICTWTLTDKEGAASYTYMLDAGMNEIRVPLHNLYRTDASAPIDVTAIRSFSLAFGRMQDTLMLKPVNLELVRYTATPAEVQVFDFGPKDSVWPGAIPVDAGLVYDNTRGYGITTLGAMDKTPRPEFVLFGDVVQAAEIGFSVRVKPGEYEVCAVAFHIAWDGVRDNANYSIEAEGSRVVATALDLQKFLSFDHHYYGADIFFNPKQPVVAQYFGRYYKPHAFTVNVEDGKLDMTFRNCTVAAVMVWPKTINGQMAADAVRDDCFFDVWKKNLRYRAHVRNEAPVEPAPADVERGYSIFSRGIQERLYPEDKPADGEELTSISVRCAPGEHTDVHFAVHPLKDIGILDVSVSQFTGQGGTIPSTVAKIYILKEHLQRASGSHHEAVPTLLVPAKPMEAFAGWNRQYCLVMQMPQDLPAGDYTGRVTIRPENGRPAEIPLTITIRPFLLEEAGASFGMWNNGVMSAHQAGAFGGSEAVELVLVEAEIADQATHGLTGYQFRDAYPIKLDENRLPVLDFSRHDRIAEVMRRHGMGKEISVIGVLGAVNYRLMRWGMKEFSAEFNTAYKHLLEGIVDWAERNGLNMVVYLVDEPRERDIQDWNRNRVDSIK
ncbi:MAG TPA: hypothetical protein ENN09_04310, partial [Planctomycetes bacterium]|nr:hypothetical protein [Planctomycetota bacterium]